jgi:glucan-binding YG repeat protein
VKDSKGWCYVDKTGYMAVSQWVKDGGWYYLDANGYMIANRSVKIGNKTYNFNASGVCTNP